MRGVQRPCGEERAQAGGRQRRGGEPADQLDGGPVRSRRCHPGRHLQGGGLRRLQRLSTGRGCGYRAKGRTARPQCRIKGHAQPADRLLRVADRADVRGDGPHAAFADARGTAPAHVQRPHTAAAGDPGHRHQPALLCKRFQGAVPPGPQHEQPDLRGRDCGLGLQPGGAAGRGAEAGRGRARGHGRLLLRRQRDDPHADLRGQVPGGEGQGPHQRGHLPAGGPGAPEGQRHPGRR